MAQQDSAGQQKKSFRSLLKESFIKEETSPLPIRILKKIDIFSFIPVPKDDPVSTKQSLIGTALFFAIFLTYIIIDFYQFVVVNPPNAENYYTKLDDQQYKLPRFAISFMSGPVLNQTQDWNSYFKFSLTKQWKDRGSENTLPIPMDINSFTNGTSLNQVDWIDNQSKKFYNVLRTSSEDIYAKGLLYSTSNASYAKIKVQLCDVTDPANNCSQLSDIQKLCAGGRIFLFVERIFDTTDFSTVSQQQQTKFLIFYSFLQPFVYKRLTFNFQVVKTTVEPDYFFRFTRQKQTRLQIGSYVEQSSNVTLNAKNGSLPVDMLGIQFQLSPQILNVHVTYKTLIDHVSMWGAFWGVLFAIFAIIFLTYNRKKFYKKNPEWDKFKNNKIAYENYEQTQKMNRQN